MYNRYISGKGCDYENLYKYDMERESPRREIPHREREKEVEHIERENKRTPLLPFRKSGLFDLNSILKRFKFDGDLIPILIILFLLLDVEGDEILIILALVFLLGL